MNTTKTPKAKPEGAASGLVRRLVLHVVPDCKEAWVKPRLYGNPFGGGYRHDIHLTPSLIWTPWQRSILATYDGVQTMAMSIGIEFWTWRAIVVIGLSRYTQNTELTDRRQTHEH